MNTMRWGDTGPDSRLEPNLSLALLPFLVLLLVLNVILIRHLILIVVQVAVIWTRCRITIRITTRTR